VRVFYYLMQKQKMLGQRYTSGAGAVIAGAMEIKMTCLDPKGNDEWQKSRLCPPREAPERQTYAIGIGSARPFLLLTIAYNCLYTFRTAMSYLWWGTRCVALFEFARRRPKMSYDEKPHFFARYLKVGRTSYSLQ